MHQNYLNAYHLIDLSSLFESIKKVIIKCIEHMNYLVYIKLIIINLFEDTLVLFTSSALQLNLKILIDFFCKVGVDAPYVF